MLKQVQGILRCGNSLDNTIVTGSGNDLIYAGAGADSVNLALGKIKLIFQKKSS